jgi:hypothetical protein
MAQQTEIDFTLPHGYLDAQGTFHRHGRMRMATALDEVTAVAHPRVVANEAYLPIVLLSRVVIALGDLSQITIDVIEALFAADMAYLEEIYEQLNSYDGILVTTQCPQCHAELRLRLLPTPSEGSTSDA